MNSVLKVKFCLTFIFSYHCSYIADNNNRGGNRNSKDKTKT